MKNDFCYQKFCNCRVELFKFALIVSREAFSNFQAQSTETLSLKGLCLVPKSDLCNRNLSKLRSLKSESNCVANGLVEETVTV